MGRPRQSVWADCRADSLGVFGLTLLFSSLAERLSRPFVRLGSKLSGGNDSRPGLLRSFLLGIATGLLWTPCAGPILGLILTGAALSGASAQTVILLLAYAAGAATSLALALLAGGRETVGAVCLGGGHRVRRCTGAEIVVAAGVGLGCERLSQEDARADSPSTTRGCWSITYLSAVYATASLICLGGLSNLLRRNADRPAAVLGLLVLVGGVLFLLPGYAVSDIGHQRAWSAPEASASFGSQTRSATSPTRCL